MIQFELVPIISAWIGFVCLVVQFGSGTLRLIWVIELKDKISKHQNIFIYFHAYVCVYSFGWIKSVTILFGVKFCVIQLKHFCLVIYYHMFKTFKSLVIYSLFALIIELEKSLSY